MELELELKITHNRDDLSTQMVDIRTTKDIPGPLFMSRETDSKFILIGHLKGFRRENIDIEINEDGSRIAISGKKPVQELELMGWIMHRKEVEIRAFRKVFRIPNGAFLDKIKAKFNDDKSTLTIVMPKLVKGLCGFGIEEVQEEKVDGDRPETTQTVAEKVPESERVKEEIEQESKKPSEMEEIDQVGERQVGPAEPEVRKDVGDEVPGKDSRLEAPKEGTVEPKIEGIEDSEQVVEETASIEPQEKAEKEIDRSQPTESPTIEETHKEKLHEERAPEQGLEEQVQDRESIVSTSPENDQATAPLESPSSTSTTDEKERPISENDLVRNEIPEELTKQEPRAEVQESTKPESCQQPEEEETSHPKDLADESNKDDVQGKEETQGNQIEEKATGDENLPREKVDEHGTQEMEKQKGLIEEPAQPSNHAPKKGMMNTPLVVAGSAFIVSLIVLVFHLIGAKKRKTKCLSG